MSKVAFKKKDFESEYDEEFVEDYYDDFAFIEESQDLEDIT